MLEPLLLPSTQDISTDISGLSESEYNKIVYEWNHNRRDFSHDKTLVQLFERQVELTPDDVAVACKAKTLTYSELNQAANQLARLIQEHYHSQNLPFEADSLIAICLDKSLEMFIGLLAILKTGAAYVPIDHQSPKERIRYVLEDTGSQILLTQQHLISGLAECVPSHISLLALDQLTLQHQEGHNLKNQINPVDLAYVIYTSGTTGYPKGVMITHRNVVNYYENVVVHFHDIENVDFSSSFAFDLSVTTMLVPLFCGKKVVIYPGDLRDVEQFIDHLLQENIHFIKSTPSYLTQVFSLPQITRIRKCFVGGEKLEQAQLHCILKHVETLFDEYGPTENTVGTTLIQKTADAPSVTFIGRAYFNHKVYVLDKNKKPVGVGVRGELYLGGAGLARGYLNRPELTHERFISNIFATELDKADGYTHLYQTGDVVSWLPDGQLQYFGRNDDQVKLYGYRIELGEIESVLARYEGIQQCVVLMHERKAASSSYHCSLVAYYLSHDVINEDELIRHLQQWLPDYMLPHQFIHMVSFPLTLNGKIDTHILRQQQTCLSMHQEYVAPRTPLEKRLCLIWQEILGVERVGILDDFFRLGGDSIQSIQLVASLLREGIHCRVKDISMYRCIQQLSLVLGRTRVIQSESGILIGDAELLPVQSWFFAQNFEHIAHWNQSFLVRVPELSFTRLNEIIPQLVDHHDMLRVCFPRQQDGSRRQQFGVEKCNLKLQYLDISELESNVRTDVVSQILTSWQDKFNLEQGPLWQMGYITGYADGSARLYFAAHHLIIDTVSWRILIDDIKRLYLGELLGQKGSSYRQWVTAIHHYAKAHTEERYYWQEASSLGQPLPKQIFSTHAYFASFKLDEGLTQQLTGIANKAYHTEINDLLLTAFGLTLSLYFGETSHRITLEGHGREEWDEALDVSRTIGWFTSMFPVTLSVKEDLEHTLLSIKEYLRTIPNKGIGYGALRYCDSTSTIFGDLPQILFNYLGQFDNSSGYWQIVLESSGQSVHPDNIHPHVLDTTALVVDGALHVSLSSYLSQNACTEISRLFEKQLVKLIEHCTLQVHDGREIFTPSDFNYVKLSHHLLNTLQSNDSGILAVYRANSLQQGFLYHAITQPDSDAYRVQVFVDYYHALDIDVYQAAWLLAVEKYPILRTYFNWDDDLLQVISRNGHVAVSFHDLSERLDKAQALNQIQVEDRKVAFDLTKPTLMRVHLIRYEDDHFILLNTAHHSILDGWSLSILLDEVHHYYVDLLQGKTPKVVVDQTYLRAQDYIASHQEDANKFWDAQQQKIEYINDLNPLFSYSASLNDIKNISCPHEVVISILDKDYRLLKELVNQEGVTLNVLLQFAWHKLIQIYTGDPQTIVGTTLSGRTIPIPGIEESVGLYINTLPLMMAWCDEGSIRDHLHLITSELSAISEYSFVELASLQVEGRRLFHSLFIAENYIKSGSSDEIKKHLACQVQSTIETLDYPLALIVYEGDERVALKLKYDGTLMTQERASQLLQQLHLILQQVSVKINDHHSSIQILSKKDYQTIIYDWNNTAQNYPDDKTVHRLFEEQVLKTPNAIALSFEHQQMTYQELNSIANQWAHLLRREYQSVHTDLSPDTLISICFEPSFEMVIAILAVLKAGGAFVPIDSRYPSRRIMTLLQDNGSKWVLTMPHMTESLKALLPLESDIRVSSIPLLLKENKENLPDYVVSSDLAYVIYTSGTTGRPKGVMVSHQNLSNYFSSIIHNEAYRRTTTVDCSSSIAFDATMVVLFAPLICGHHVVLCKDEVKRDAQLYLDYLQDNQIDLIRMTPSYLSVFLMTHEHAKLRLALSKLRCLIVGGEKANIDDLRTWVTLFPECNIINHYGPTETTVACALFNISSLNQVMALDRVLLGKAQHNHQFYVLDRFLNPVPIGVVGELYVAGAGVARGYLNQPELTAERFIPHRFASERDKIQGYTRLYKTGDLVRWLPDGQLEFLGRNDLQVKIRGYRVELSEVEQALLRHPHVNQCVVVVVEKQSEQGLDHRLVAYIVSASPVDPSLLKNYLDDYLPSYMVPSAFIRVDYFPLTPNGKLDKKALPEAMWIDDQIEYMAPRDELETFLCSTWQSVLGVERVGVHDDFFSLGGHSILAIQAVHRISQGTHRQIFVADLFKHKTVARLSSALREGQHIDDMMPLAGSLAPLSYAVERLWFIEQYENGASLYHIPFIFTLGHTTNSSALKQAIQAMVQRHEILRTIFTQSNDGVYQQSVQEGLLMIVDEQVDDSEFARYKQELLHRPFDLTSEFPLRAGLFFMPQSNEKFLILVFHHVAFDAWSKDIFMRELNHYYHAFHHDIEPSLPPLSVQYKDFSIWQRQKLSTEMDSLLEYWREKLMGHESLGFLTDYPRPATLDYRGDVVHIALPKTTSFKLRQFAELNGVTIYTVLLTGFAIALSKYTNQNDLMIGTPIANRDHPQLSGLIGFFVNLLALRIQLKPTYTFKECMLNIYTNLIEAQSQQDLPFSKLVEYLVPERDESRHPLFQVLFNVEYQSIDHASKLGLQALSIENDSLTAKFDLSVSMQEREDGIRGMFQYATSLFSRETIKRFSAHYERILVDFVEYQEKSLNTYLLLSRAEYQQIIYDWNATQADYPRDKTIVQLFEEQVRRTPDNVALVDDYSTLTYRVLNEKSNQLARLICKCYQVNQNSSVSLSPDTLVAICLERTVDAVIAMLAVLKTGGAYVVLEPHAPVDRVRHILSDTKTRLILTQKHLVTMFESRPDDISVLMTDHEAAADQASDNLSVHPKGHHLAYVIYTSGTTGLPKGVMIEHRGLTNIIHQIPTQLRMSAATHALQFAAFTFDASVLQIFSTLTIGAKLFIAPQRVREDAKALATYLKYHRISYAGIPPAFLSHLEFSDFPDLKTLVVAGESSNEKLMSQWRPGRCLINAYGPTENTIGASLNHFEHGDSVTNIGRPLPNIRAYVLDSQLTPVPIGVSGELYLGGAGVARGYLNRPELTAERFIVNPFASELDKLEGYTRLYKTGDLVRWLPNGQLEFLGRDDSQIKIRGYRVELSEIEQVLLQHASIQQCVVVLEKKSAHTENKKLVAYFTSSLPVSSSALKSYVERYLPDYMIPSVFMRIDALPLTTNGKLDRKALPEPVWEREQTQYTAPRDELESFLCSVWQSVLGVDRVGIEDDFFSLGGHSILAIQLVHQMSQGTYRQVAVADLFKYRTISGLSAVLRTGERLDDIYPVAGLLAPLSYAAERLWFIEQYENGVDAYHIPLIFELDTTINLDALKKALQAIVYRHEILRTVFVQNEEGIFQQRVEDRTVDILLKHVDENTYMMQQKELLHRAFDLTVDFPCRMCLFSIEGSHKSFLTIVFHHVAFDGWSKDIFRKELSHYYHAFVQGVQPSLVPLSIQYNDFSIWQREKVSAHLDSLFSYWQSKLMNHVLLTFPTDYPRPLSMDYRGDVVAFSLPSALSEQLDLLASTHHVTLYSVLLGGFVLLLSKYTGQQDILIGTPVVNRQHPQLAGLIGLFINSLALRFEVDTTHSVVQYLQKIQQNLIEAQCHQDLPFEQLVSRLNLFRDVSRHPLFQIMFTLQHQHNQHDELCLDPWTHVVQHENEQSAKFDLAIAVQKSNQDLRVSIQYATALFKRETIDRIANHYEHLLSEMVIDSQRSINACQMLTKLEYQQMIYDWNETSSPYPKDCSIQQLFEAQVDAQSDRVAVIFQERSLTYRELNEKSNQLANFLRRQYQENQIKPGTLIGLCLEPSLDIVIAILGVLKAGAAYVPIDSSYPDARIRYILKDAGCQLILTHQKLRHLFDNFSDIELVCLDENAYQQQSMTLVPSMTKANDLAYVLYTSGTTGFPKGVMIEHRSVICLVYSRLCEGIHAGTKGSLWTNITFDVSVYEIFSILLKGGELHIIPEQFRLDDHALFEYFLKYAISSIYLPPFFVEKISNHLLKHTGDVSIQKVLLGVEPIPVRHLSGFILNKIAVFNAYGPTEATVSSTAYRLDDAKKISGQILPIGRALNNEVAYVLDAELSPVPVGVIGELYLGGDGLARGYLNQVELNAERFISNPFSIEPHLSRLYKTGDLVRWLPEGELEYVGRVDFQVKIHGYRIELAEVEQVLMRHPAVMHAVVLCRENKLVAYYTGQVVGDDELRHELLKMLPEYMVPNIFIYLTEFSFNLSGKLNKEALPVPIFNQSEAVFVRPRHATDEKICSVWKEVLKQDKIGITDDFFRLGGDSIASLQVISKLRYANIHCTIKDIFRCRTIERLVDDVLAQASRHEVSAEQGVLGGSFGLLPIQSWFFDQKFSEAAHWNQAFFVRVPILSLERLTLILPLLINQHDMLRVQFSERNGHYEQCYGPAVYDATIESFDLSKIPKEEQDARLLAQLNAWQSGFNIEIGPLWRLAYIDGYADGSARLFFVCHHLLIDTVSWRILVDDLKRLYYGDALGAKTSSYRQWYQALQAYSYHHQDELNFWSAQRHTRPDMEVSELHRSETLVFDSELTSQLIQQANRAYHTETTDLLITALVYALQKVMGGSQYAVTLEGHGREPIDECLDLSSTVGWFTTLFPVLFSVQETLSSSLCDIKDRLRSVPNKGIGYGVLASSRDLSPIYFNYFGQIEASSEDWSFVSEHTGMNIHPNNIHHFLILMNAKIMQGMLYVHLGTRLDAVSSKVFMETFKSTLIDLIEHCVYQVNQGKFTYTQSDFAAVHTEADLSRLPIQHDPVDYYQPFEMTGIQKAYAIGRLNQFEIGNVANHLYTEFSFDELDVARLERALNRLIAEHDEIRTVFDQENLTQRYLPYSDAMYYHITTHRVDQMFSESSLLAIRNKLSHLVYDVSTYPLFQMCVSIFHDRAVLHVSFDLLLLDAQGRTKFFTELTQLYEKEDATFSKRSITFRDYQVYMGMLKSSPWYLAHKAYWREKVNQLPLRPKLLLACDPRDIEYPKFKLSKRQISADVWGRFKQKADDYGVSQAAVLLSLYGYILSRFSETSDFLITMTLFNRYGLHPDVNELWGDFTSTNLFGFSRKDCSALDFFKYTHHNLWDDIEHALYTGLDVQRDLMTLHQLDPTMAASPIVFTCILTDAQHRTRQRPAYLIKSDERRDERYWIGQTSQAWIDLQATEREGVFTSGWLYVSQLFPEGFIDQLNDAYCDLIAYLADRNWDIFLPTPALPSAHWALINAANTVQQVIPKRTMVSYFSDQVRRTPDAIAVIDTTGAYRYEVLQFYSWHIAWALYEHGVERKQLVAVLCEKGLGQAAVTLGVMTTGAAYLPLNVEWPLGRIEEVLIEGDVSHVLVSEMQWNVIKDTPIASNYMIHRFELYPKNLCQEPPCALMVSPEDPAYVIFTSGSTGKPKGVCISHVGAVNTLVAVNERFKINQHDVVLAISDLSFDLSVYDLFGVLGAGGRVVFPDQMLAKEPSHWVALAKQHGVTVWNSVPQLMQLFIDEIGHQSTYLRVVLLSGDWVPTALVHRAKFLPSKPTVVSLGGATEASIWSIWYEIDERSSRQTIPYGFPMPNQKVYVLNAFGEHCALGVAGEIYLGGCGLALLYWRDPSKTKMSFIEHPELGRLYKTGDIGKWHPDGFIEFLGRKDNQIKRNGNRMELDEISTRLTQLNGIDNALVRMHENRLVAYIVSQEFQSKYPADFDMQQFKLAQHGLRRDLISTHVFNLSLDERLYRSYKSYRQFSDTQLIDAQIEPPAQSIKNENILHQIKSLDDLAVLLSPLSACQLNDKLLPKYLYPSAGSSYAIRCNVYLPSQLESLQPGCYYYHPVLHALQRVGDYSGHDFFLQFSLHRPAIEPLYSQDSLRMAAIELGHMLNLLTDVLYKNHMGYALKLSDCDIDKKQEDHVLATLILNTTGYINDLAIDKLNTALLSKQGQCFKDSQRVFDLQQQTVIMNTSEVGHIMHNSQALIVFESEENTVSAWMSAGYLAQRYIAHWQTLKVAYCSLGLRPIKGALYAFALGGRREEDELLGETHASGRDLPDTLTSVLSQYLPCYMIPDAFIKLSALPLTANGKVDFQALPHPELSLTTNTYVPPRTDLETQICAVWEKVLGVPRVGIEDDFFRIGGDSILCIHVTSMLRKQGIICTALSIFEHRRVDRLALNVEIDRVSEQVVNDALMDVSHVDISSDLLARLESRYQKEFIVEDVEQ